MHCTNYSENHYYVLHSTAANVLSLQFLFVNSLFLQLRCVYVGRSRFFSVPFVLMVRLVLVWMCLGHIWVVEGSFASILVICCCCVTNSSAILVSCMAAAAVADCVCIANGLLFKIPFDNFLKWSKHYHTSFHIQTVWFLLTCSFLVRYIFDEEFSILWSAPLSAPLCCGVTLQIPGYVVECYNNNNRTIKINLKKTGRALNPYSFSVYPTKSSTHSWTLF